MGEQDKMVGQRTAWIIGGEPGKPPLKPDATTTYNFVIDTEKPVIFSRIIFNRLILDPDDRICPKLGELEKLLEECAGNDAKAIIFSEWERMLELVRDLCDERDIGFAWHTGTVPQQRRRAEINAFKSDPACRVFLSTDSGATGLNLQIASVVVNLRSAMEPGETRTAHRPRLAQTPDPARNCN